MRVAMPDVGVDVSKASVEISTGGAVERVANTRVKLEAFFRGLPVPARVAVDCQSTDRAPRRRGPMCRRPTCRYTRRRASLRGRRPSILIVVVAKTWPSNGNSFLCTCSLAVLCPTGQSALRLQ